MGIKAGIGNSTLSDSFNAGVEAAENAVSSSGIKNPSFAFVFAAGKHQPEKFIEGVKSVTGNIKFFGASGGVITSDYLGYGEYEAAVGLIGANDSDGSGNIFAADSYLVNDLNNNEFNTGLKLGELLNELKQKKKFNTILFYDSLKKTSREGQPELNLATPLLEGISRKFNLTEYPFAGAGSLADVMLYNDSYVYTEKGIQTQSAAALTIPDEINMDVIILHGCKPAGRYHTITKTEGNVVFEIDNRPALDVITALLGPDSGIEIKDFPFLITLGINRGDKYESFKEENYANRLCLAVDEQNKAMIMFEPDLKPGMEVQLMRRSIDFKYIDERINNAIVHLDKTPFLALYIDCLGRCATYSGIDKEEAWEVQRCLKIHNIPLIGFYSGVEMAKIGTVVQALDWTGVLCILSH